MNNRDSRSNRRKVATEAMRGDVGEAFGAVKEILDRGLGTAVRIDNVVDRQRGEVIVTTKKAPEGYKVIFRKTANDTIDVRYRTPEMKSKRLAEFTPSEIMKGGKADAGLIKDVLRDFHSMVGVSESTDRQPEYRNRNSTQRGQEMGSDLQNRIAESLDKTSRDPSARRSREMGREAPEQGGSSSRQRQVESNQSSGSNEPSREELREALDEMTRSYLTAKALLDIPKEEHNDFLESLEPSDSFKSLSEFRSYINTRKREFVGEEDDDEGPGSEDWVHEVAQRIGDVAGWEGIERVDIAPAGIKRPSDVEGTIVRVNKPDYADMPTEKEMESVRAKIRSEFPGVLSIWRGGHSIMFTARGVSKSVVERSQGRGTFQDNRFEESMEGIPDANKDIGGRIAYLAGYRS